MTTSDPGVRFGFKNPDESPLDKGAYFGTDPIYQNAANETDEPLNNDDEAGDPPSTDFDDEGNRVSVAGVPIEKDESDDDESDDDDDESTPAEPPAPPKEPQAVDAETPKAPPAPKAKAAEKS